MQLSIRPLLKFVSKVQKNFCNSNFQSRPNFVSFHLVHEQNLLLCTNIAVTYFICCCTGWKWHINVLLVTILEIGLEHAPFVVLVYFFPSFEHAKNLLVMGPNNTKNSSLKCDFLIFNYELYCQNLVFIVKTPNLIKKLFLCFASKPRVGPINSKHNNFNWGNILCRHLHSSLISMVTTQQQWHCWYKWY